jgi:hypothetical protein
MGVSQPYWSLLERGERPLPRTLARRLVRDGNFPPTLLPLPARLEDATPADNDALAEDLAKLGYPAFAYLLRGKRPRRNPALVLLSALALADLDPRVTEGLPWLLLHHPNMNQDWLLDQAKQHNLQNRLGFMVSLARRVAEGYAPLSHRAVPLQHFENVASPSRLAQEETFSEPASDRMREWLKANRTEDAAAWNLLTDWKPEHLQYATYP